MAFSQIMLTIQTTNKEILAYFTITKNKWWGRFTLLLKIRTLGEDCIITNAFYNLIDAEAGLCF